MKKNYRCVLLNLPGFGNTEGLSEPSIYALSKYINDQIEVLQLEEYILCGHSMGAKLVLYAAKLETVRKPNKIILISPLPLKAEDKLFKHNIRAHEYPNAEEALKLVSNATYKRLGRKKLKHASESWLKIEPRTWKWWLSEGIKNDISERIQGLDMPVHVIFSNVDPIIESNSVYEQILPYINYSAIVTLSRVGHLIPLEAPRKLARQIKKIAKEV